MNFVNVTHLEGKKPKEAALMAAAALGLPLPSEAYDDPVEQAYLIQRAYSAARDLRDEARYAEREWFRLYKESQDRLGRKVIE